MRPFDKAALVYVLALTSLLAYTATPGIWTNDEATYLLMVKSIAVDGHFHILNGVHRVYSPAFIPHATELFFDGTQYRLYGMPAPAYLMFSTPFYLAFGVAGLNMMNSIFYGLSVGVLYLIGRRLVSPGIALVSAILYSMTYSLQYSQMLWPHSLSVFLVLSSCYLAIKGIGSDSTLKFPIFMSGFLIGLSVGIRYLNGVFLVLMLAFFVVRFGSKAMPFIFGASIPMLAIACYNHIFLGSIFTVSYPDSAIKNVAPGFATILFLITAFIFIRKKGISIPMSQNKAALAICILAIAGYLLVPAIQSAADKAFTAIFDSSWKQDYPMVKKSLLQSVPYLILSAHGAILIIGISGKEKAILPVLIPLSQLFLTTVLSMGGTMETFGMRYLLESVPFLVMFSAVSMHKLLGNISKNEFILSASLVIFFSYILSLFSILNYVDFMHISSRQIHNFLPDFDLIHVSSGYMYHLPMLLYASLGIASFARSRSMFPKKAILALIILCVTYSFAVACANTFSIYLTRNMSWNISSDLFEVITDGSLVVVPNPQYYGLLAPVKVYKDIDIVFPYLDDGKSLDGLILHYSLNGRDVYVTQTNDDIWNDAVYDFVESANLTNVNYFKVDFDCRLQSFFS